MARFKFPLQALLHIRERAERDEQIALAELERERLAFDGDLRRVQASIRDAQEDARGLLHPKDAPLNVPAARLQAHAALHLQGRAAQLGVSLSGAEVRSDQQRERLLRASIARRALERLRQRRLDQWEKEQHRKEQRELDDLATARVARQGRKIEP